MPAAKPPFPVLRRGHPLAQGVVGLWPCYEGSGLTLNDLSGNGNNGTLQGGVSWVGGQSGWCLKFDGSSGLVSVSSVPRTTTFTVGCWCLPTFSSGSFLRLIDTDFATDFYLGTDSSGTQWQAYVNGSTTGASGSITQNQWFFVVLTYDGATGRLYVNGAQIGSVSVSPPSAGNVPLVIGRQVNSFTAYWQGLIDAPFLYSFALTQPQIASLMADSWQMVRPPRRQPVIRKAAGGLLLRRRRAAG